MKLWHKIATLFIFQISLILLLPYTQAANSTNSYNYITRDQWGANEDLRLYNENNPTPDLIVLSPEFYIRYADELRLQKIISRNEDGEKITWPLQYPEKVSKIFIHHTGSSANLDNPMQVVSNIYTSHTITRGWGDIGYNYLIDPEGNVYEGRYGGEGVIGAHVGPMGNRGSIGIALLGNYDENEVPEKAKNALITLLSEKTKTYGIDPEGSSYFRGDYIPNITGHGTVMKTSCPGKNLSNLLPTIKETVADLNGAIDYSTKESYLAIKDFSFEYIPVLKEITMPADRKMEYVVKLKNTGKETWDGNTRISLMSDPLVKRSFIIGTSNINEKQVSPGEIGSFKVTIQSKLYGGFNYIRFRPLFNGQILSENAVSIPTKVTDPHFDYEVLGFSIPKNSISLEESLTAIVTLKNTGNVKWRNYGIHRISLGSINPTDRESEFTKSTRMGFLEEPIVNPGQVGHFVFNLKAPSKIGSYTEYFAPVIESITWLDGKNMKFDLKVI